MELYSRDQAFLIEEDKLPKCWQLFIGQLLEKSFCFLINESFRVLPEKVGQVQEINDLHVMHVDSFQSKHCRALWPRETPSLNNRNILRFSMGETEQVGDCSPQMEKASKDPDTSGSLGSIS